MAKHFDVIGTTEDGSAYCVDCNPVDERNPEQGVIFAGDEGPSMGVDCDRCGCWIQEPYDEKTVEEFVLEMSTDQSYMDEECGNASEGTMWAGLFLDVSSETMRDLGMHVLAEQGMTSFVLTIDSYGFKEVDEYKNADDACHAFEELREEIDPQEPVDNETLDMFSEQE
jgi:hypothetical protein